MADVKWIKITTDMFDNRKIKHLRKLPDGNNIVLIWVMLLTMAGRCNSGGMIFLTENIPYTPKMLADELDFEESTVTLALQALERLGMVSTTANGFLNLPGWEDHQSIEGMAKIREQNRLRQKRWYDKQKELPSANGSPNVRNNVTVTDYNATDIDKEEDIEREEEKNSILSASDEAGEQPTKPKRSKRFTPPEVEEVAAYCEERKNGIDAQHFVDYYEARGWMIGKNRMKDWKAAVRTWERNRDGGGTNGKPEKPAYDAGAFGTIL